MWVAARILILLSAVALASQDHQSGGCVFEGRAVPDGARMTKDDPCHLCHCHGGRVECVWKHCGPPPPRCRTLETENGCNQTVYLCPLPDDNSSDSSPVSSEGTTTLTTLGPYFHPLASSSPNADALLLTRFSLLPPPLPSLSPLSPPEGRETDEDDEDEPGTAPTYFNEFSSAPMNFSAALSRGEGPRSPRRLTLTNEGWGDSAEETAPSDRLHFSSPPPWASSRPDDEVVERTSEETTQRTTQKPSGRTGFRPASRGTFRIARPQTVPPAERSNPSSQPTLRTSPWTSPKDLATTSPKTSRGSTTWTTRTTPRVRESTTSQTTAGSSSRFPELTSARPDSKPRRRLPKRPNLLLAIRERIRSEENSFETTTTHAPVPPPDFLRASQHPILRPRIRPLSLAEPSKLVTTSARPETTSQEEIKPQRLSSRNSRRQLKTLSTTRHRLQRLFPSTVRPETSSAFREWPSRELDTTTTTTTTTTTQKPETTTFPSSRRRVRPQPAFEASRTADPILPPRSQFAFQAPRSAGPILPPRSQFAFQAPSSFEPILQPRSQFTFNAPSSAGPIPQPRSQFRSSSPQNRLSSLSTFASRSANPSSFPSFEEASATAPGREENGSPLIERELPQIISAPAAVALAAPVVSFDYDIEDDNIDLTEYEFPEFGQRLKRDSSRSESRQADRDAARYSSRIEENQGTEELGSWKGSRPRRSLLPGDDRHGHGHHGHHDEHHPHHPDMKNHHDPNQHHGDHRHHDEHDGMADRNRVLPNVNAEDDFRSFRPVDQKLDEPTTCFISGLRFKLGEVIEAASDSCLECRCAGAAMFCYPKCCFYTTEVPRDGQSVNVLI